MASAKPQYEWILCHSPSPKAPLRPLDKIASLHNAKDRNFSVVRNRAGTASLSLRTTDEMAYEILDNVDLNDVRGTIRKSVLIRRNDKSIWSGPIWGINGSLDQDNINISCVGWQETLPHRILVDVADYSNDGNGFPGDHIAFDLLSRVNTYDPVHPLYISPGAVHGAMENRNRYYQRGQSLGAAIQELSDVEAGFDYTINPDTRQMDLWSWDSFRTLNDVLLGYRVGPDNLKTFGWQESADKMCNRMWVTSLGAPVGPILDFDSMDTYGAFEEWNTITGANQAILAPYAEAELVVRGHPIVTYTVTPKTHVQNFSGPSLFDDYDIGDAMFMSAKKGAFKLKKQKIRVFGASVALDDNGNETIGALQLAPEGA